MKRREKAGFTLVEIMIVVAIIALLAAIAIPNVLRGRTTANESSAIGNLRALVSSLEMYRSVQNNYPDAWQADMYTTPNPDFGPPSFNNTMAGGATAATGLVQGFTYTYTNLPAACVEPACTQYDILAVPQTLNTTGTRSFFANETGLISHCTGTGTRAHFTDGNEATIDQQPTACD
jgi:prepilin-type N-terminal cleavage/methylation domain-containing protein